MSNENGASSNNFIHDVIDGHNESGRFKGQVNTRFPPEPNGYLHLGHATAIHTNFSIAAKYGGKTNLRFDDTNPTKEKVEFVDGIMDDIRWLGFEWDNLHYALRLF